MRERRVYLCVGVGDEDVAESAVEPRIVFLVGVDERVTVRTYPALWGFLNEKKNSTPGVPPGICQNHQDCDNFTPRFDFLFDSNERQIFAFLSSPGRVGMR